MLRVAVASLLLACSHPANPGVPPAGTPTAANATQGTLRSGPPLVTPGELMIYKLSLQGVELASYQLSVGDITDLGGKRAIVVQGHAKVTGFAAFLATIDDRFTSWIDLATGHPLRFQTDEYASGSKRDIEHAVVDLAGRDGDTVPVTFRLNDAPPRPEPQKVSQPVVWDYNAFLVALRSWEPEAGTRMTFEVFRSRFLWHVDVAVRGKERLVTELGELPSLRIDGRTYKLDRKGGRDPDSAERSFSLWISNDEGRVPLAIKATTDYGDLKLQITEYQPGNGKRL